MLVAGERPKSRGGQRVEALPQAGWVAGRGHSRGGPVARSRSRPQSENGLSFSVTGASSVPKIETCLPIVSRSSQEGKPTLTRANDAASKGSNVRGVDAVCCRR